MGLRTPRALQTSSALDTEIDVVNAIDDETVGGSHEPSRRLARVGAGRIERVRDPAPRPMAAPRVLSSEARRRTQDHATQQSTTQEAGEIAAALCRRSSGPIQSAGLAELAYLARQSMAGSPSGNREPVGPTHRAAIERAGHPVMARRQDATTPLAMSLGDAAKMLGNGAAVLAEVANALAHLAYEAAGVNDVESSGPAALPPASLARTVGPLRPQPALVDASTAARFLGISVAALRKRVQRGHLPRGAVSFSGRRYYFRRDRLL